MLAVFHYSDPCQFLRDAWKAKNAANPAFSLRAWSKKLGFENSAPLSLMLGGKRPIPKKYLPAFISQLELTPAEGHFLEALVECRQAKTPEAKHYYYQRLRDLSPNAPVTMVEIEQFKYLEDPLHMTILEMVDLADFDPDPRQIQRRLRRKSSVQEVKDAIERLETLKFLFRDESGALRKSQAHLATKADIQDAAVTLYHQNVARMAAEQVVVQGVLQREFNAFAMNIAKKDLPKAKKLLREFADTFIREVEAKPAHGEETYQLNLQFFSLTKCEGNQA